MIHNVVLSASNEMNDDLERVAPLTHAIGNVLKRVFVIGFPIVVFGAEQANTKLRTGNKISTHTGIGTAIAIAGVAIYSYLMAKIEEEQRVSLDTCLLFQQSDPTQVDRRIWTPAIDGEFTVAAAHEQVRKKNAKPGWASFLWKALVHPRTTAIGWKSLQEVMHTHDSLVKRKFHVASSDHLSGGSLED
ncbi:hypothetical protein IFM89_008203 [Coptis chinensis]|uniref:Uncharacterized protein n=1 Tax=Coptis chinensis TaxID=261450 RepID=A0A835LDV9_9MAGN|nr:hypothetical protein IFM89_008203 [Coptis chinensis]